MTGIGCYLDETDEFVGKGVEFPRGVYGVLPASHFTTISHTMTAVGRRQIELEGAGKCRILTF